MELIRHLLIIRQNQKSPSFNNLRPKRVHIMLSTSKTGLVWLPSVTVCQLQLRSKVTLFGFYFCPLQNQKSRHLVRLRRSLLLCKLIKARINNWIMLYFYLLFIFVILLYLFSGTQLQGKASIFPTDNISLVFYPFFFFFLTAWGLSVG